MCDQSQQPNPDDLRAEYAALISYHNSIVAHRFTLLGFFLATVGILAKDGMQIQTALLLLIITLALWIVERRNRVLYTQMGKRAMQIEKIHWGLIKCNKENKIAELPLFCRFRLDELVNGLKKENLTDELKNELDSLKKWSIRRLTASHSRGLDLLYAAVAIYAILCIIGVIPYKAVGNK